MAALEVAAVELDDDGAVVMVALDVEEEDPVVVEASVEVKAIVVES